MLCNLWACKGKRFTKPQRKRRKRIYNNILVMITCENVVNIVQNSRRMKWKWSSRKQTKTTKTVGITTATITKTTITVVTTAKQSECAQKYAAITATPAKQLRCQSVYVCSSSCVFVCMFATVSVCVSDLYLCLCVCISSCCIRNAFNFVAFEKNGVLLLLLVFHEYLVFCSCCC